MGMKWLREGCELRQFHNTTTLSHYFRAAAKEDCAEITVLFNLICSECVQSFPITKADTGYIYYLSFH